MNYPLSEEDLLHNLDVYGVKVVDAADVHPSDFDPDGLGAIALFHRNPHKNVGHWTLLTQRSAGIYEHFDSLCANSYLGDLEDSWGVSHNHGDGRWNGCKFTRSKKRLQTAKSSTCGRWLCWRVMMLKCKLPAFEKFCTEAGVDDKFLTTKLTLIPAPQTTPY